MGGTGDNRLFRRVDDDTVRVKAKPMQWQDITLLGKKILVGTALIVAPLLIVVSALRITQQVLSNGSQPERSAHYSK
jgi:hypothetical protein